MEKIERFFYLNLDRRTDRKKHFIDECHRVMLPMDKVERYPALDGLVYNLTEKEKPMFEKCDYKNARFFNKIACNQLGHYYILKEIVNKKYEYAIIFQDDVILRDNFVNDLNNLMNNYPMDADLLNIGFHKFASMSRFIAWDLSRTPLEDSQNLSNTKINDYVCKLKNGINPCSLAYIVSLQGAKNLIEYFDKVGFERATDGNFNDYCISNDIFYGSIPVLCTGNPNLGSDIFK